MPILPNNSGANQKPGMAKYHGGYPESRGIQGDPAPLAVPGWTPLESQEKLKRDNHTDVIQ